MKAKAAFSLRRLEEDSFFTWQALSAHWKENFLPPGITLSMSPTSHSMSLVCASADQRPLTPESGQKRFSREEYQKKSNIEQHFCHVLPSLQLLEMDVVFMSKKASKCSSLH